MILNHLTHTCWFKNLRRNKISPYLTGLKDEEKYSKKVGDDWILWLVAAFTVLYPGSGDISTFC